MAGCCVHPPCDSPPAGATNTKAATHSLKTISPGKPRRSVPGTILPYLLGFLFALLLPPLAAAQESAYIVTYNHYLEEPGNLEVEYNSTAGTQRGGNGFMAYWAELEYGATAWWTTEL